tara:strand:- start:43 stop:396 length:354 start_codon:yes stop_codon:yes gene_type:complete
MSAEVGVIALLGKYVWLPLLGILGGFTRSYFNKLDIRLAVVEAKEVALEQKLVGLEMDITKNYYDKEEIKEHIAEPLLATIRETREDLKQFSTLLNEIHQDMGILKYKILGDELKNQ